MPLLVLATGWWLVGLFTGAILAQWTGRPAWLASVMSAPLLPGRVLLASIVALVGIVVLLIWISKHNIP